MSKKKTSIIETMNKQKRCKSKGNPPQLMVVKKEGILVPKIAEKILDFRNKCQSRPVMEITSN